MTASECGAACLAMVLAYYGRRTSLEEVRALISSSRDGVSALDVVNAGRHFGMRGRGVKVELDELRLLPRGAILHWDFRHFVVLDRIRRNGKLEIVDPMDGRRVVSRKQTATSFTGVAILFEPTELFEHRRAGSVWHLRYFRRVLAGSRNVMPLLLLSVFAQLLALLIPGVTGAIVDRVVPRADINLLNVLAGGAMVCVAFQFVATLLRSYLLLGLRTILDAQLTTEFLDHLLALPFPFFQGRRSGDLLMRLNSNATVREILTSSTLTTLFDGLFVGLYMAVFFFLSWQMALVVLGVICVQLIIYACTHSRRQELVSEYVQAQARSQSFQVELLNAVQTLKGMGGERRVVEQWSRLFVDELNASLESNKADAKVGAVLSALHIIGPLAILFIGAHEALAGRQSLGTIIALNAVAGLVFAPIGALFQSAMQFQLLGVYLRRIADVLETPPEEETGRRRVDVSGRLELVNVSFRYQPNAPFAVKDVSFKVEPGELVAIVGRSGCGKSTLASLLLGLHLPTSGRISLAGIDTGSIDLHDLRRRMGVVMQQPALFGLSIRDNIALLDPSASLERIVRAAQLACLHDDIQAMPLGYDTIVIEGGGSLSGGQRQRLALARALLANPSLLLLDEATSSLDSITEEKVHRNLSTLRCTRIVLAHRMSTTRIADRILVLEQGRVVEEGCHKTLLARSGAYAELMSGQLGCATRPLPPWSQPG